MGLKATMPTTFGETRELYFRVISAEVSNHGVCSTALVRGFLSQEAYALGKAYVFEHEVSFMADVTLPLWPQVYAALKALPLEELPPEPSPPEPNKPIPPEATKLWQEAAAEVEARNVVALTLQDAADVLEEAPPSETPQ